MLPTLSSLALPAQQDSAGISETLGIWLPDPADLDRGVKFAGAAGPDKARRWIGAHVLGLAETPALKAACQVCKATLGKDIRTETVGLRDCFQNLRGPGMTIKVWPQTRFPYPLPKAVPGGKGQGPPKALTRERGLNTLL